MKTMRRWLGLVVVVPYIIYPSSGPNMGTMCIPIDLSATAGTTTPNCSDLCNLPAPSTAPITSINMKAASGDCYQMFINADGTWGANWFKCP